MIYTDMFNLWERDMFNRWKCTVIIMFSMQETLYLTEVSWKGPSVLSIQLPWHKTPKKRNENMREVIGRNTAFQSCAIS